MSFSVKTYLEIIGNSLISDFENASRLVTHTSTQGAIKEMASIKYLQKILHNGFGIGQGHVIDFEGQQSKQQDIVFYESNVGVSYPHGHIAFYPCEHVISAGEVKTTLSSDTLKDSFEKACSVKQLNRVGIKELCCNWAAKDLIVHPRYYFDQKIQKAVKLFEFDQFNKPGDNMHYFLIAGRLGLKPETFQEKLAELEKQYRFSPDVIVVLGTDGEKPCAVLPWEKEQIHIFSGESTNLKYSEDETPFATLLTQILMASNKGRTVGVASNSLYLNFMDAQALKHINGQLSESKS